MLRTILAAALAACAIAPAQTPAAAPATPTLAFDVASIRASATLDPQKIQAAMRAGQMPRFGAHIDGLRAEYSQMTLKDLVANAYEVKPYQVSGPDLINGQRFDILANMPEGSAKNDAPGMLRTLLAARFKLEAVKSLQDHPVYALVIGKGGPKLKESADKPIPIDPNAELKPGEMKIDGPQGLMIVKQNPDGTSTANMGEQGRFTQQFDGQAGVVHIEGTSVSMKGLAQLLSQMFTMGGNSASGREVIDSTDLTGYYDISLDLSIAELMRSGGGPPPPPPPPGGPTANTSQASDPGGGGATVFESVQKMGLKLDPRKAPVEQVVVTHIEKSPTEN